MGEKIRKIFLFEAFHNVFSPAKRFLGRELNSPLNLSAVAKAKSKPTPISRPPVSFSEGERVAARNYSRHQGKKWLIGKIVSKDGEVNYTVSVNDSLHRFHVDQLRKIDQNISPTGIVPIFFPAERSESPEPPQDPGESPVPQREPREPPKSPPPVVRRSKPPVVRKSKPSVIRKSSRSRRQPNRLNL
ncbi:unnamed protein product [Allacma fusca]|uniref:Uncharacterized protein n=1 Tax=Allacma fusca TaxID=39272 RepID=A0A8J2PGD4_9HEXA|nr:unnamed protein product [Allacma fusca]